MGSMSYDRDALVAEHAQLKARARELMAKFQATCRREEELAEKLVGPSVIVVTETYRHGWVDIEGLDLGSTLRDAVSPLWAAQENELGSPSGAYVGGAFVSYEALVAEYGTPEDWHDDEAAS